MMPKITPDLLNDTLNLIQLARETALAKGNKDQAERLAPLADNLRDLVKTSRQQKSLLPQSEMMNQSDFKTILSAVQSLPPSASKSTSALERQQVVASMSEAGMSEIDIARHLGITREEVHLVLNVNKRNWNIGEVLK